MLNFPFLYTKTKKNLMGCWFPLCPGIFGTQHTYQVVQPWSYTCAHHPVLDDGAKYEKSLHVGIIKLIILEHGHCSMCVKEGGFIIL